MFSVFEAFSNIKNIDLPEMKRLTIIGNEIAKELTWPQFQHAFQVLKYTWKFRYFPEFSQWVDASHQSFGSQDKKKYLSWQSEFANKLEIPVEQFVNVHGWDLTKDQRQKIGVMEHEEIKGLFTGIRKDLKLRETFKIG